MLNVSLDEYAALIVFSDLEREAAEFYTHHQQVEARQEEVIAEK